MLAVGFSCMCFIRLENFSFSSSFWEYHVCVLNFDRCFFYMHWDDFSLLCECDLLHWLTNVKTKLAFLVQTLLCNDVSFFLYSSGFSILFHFYAYAHEKEWPLIFHSCKFCLVLVSDLVQLGCIYKHIHFQHKSKHTVHSENKTKGGKKENSTTESRQMMKEEGKRKKKGKKELQSK